MYNEYIKDYKMEKDVYMYNYGNLSHFEFELLVKDILEKKLSIKLRSYSAGKDRGIDIRGYVGNEIIIQVKHYYNSKYPDLKTALEKELKKVEELKPKRYIIVTSLGLLPQYEDEIFELFQGFIISKEDIIDGNCLNSFLEKDCNNDILKIHNKLWLTSTNVLDLIFHKNLDIDSRAFVSDYEMRARLFVEIEAYTDIVNYLQNENVIIIEGEPGIGKTTMSKMVAANLCKIGYKIRYASNNSINEIKKGLVQSDQEVIILDNFLGQRVADLTNHFFEELRTLIIFANTNKNKKIIINSRSIVLNEVLSKNQSFSDCLEFWNIHKYRLDSNNLSCIDKSKMLYNHIRFNELDENYYKAIRTDERYLQIVQHKNFSPRLIEYVTRIKKVKQIPSNGYFDYILNILNNPKDIWQDELNSLTREERIFTFTVYSLILYGRFNREFVESSLVKKCFDIRINKENKCDTTLDVFNNVLNKLNEGLIKIELNGEYIRIAFINPSVEDYIYNTLSKLDNEIKQIAESAIYIEQLLTLEKLQNPILKDIIIKKIEDNSFLELKTFLNLNIYHYFLKFVFEYECKYQELNKMIFNIFFEMKPFVEEKDDNSELIINFFFEKGMYDYYNLHKLFNNDGLIYKIYEYLKFNQMIKFIRLHENYANTNIGYKLSDNLLYYINDFIKWEIELEIIHNEKWLLEYGLSEISKQFDICSFYSNEELEKEIKKLEIKFTNDYIYPAIEENIKYLDFATIIAKNIKVNTEIILSEIDFRESLLRDNSNYEYYSDKGFEFRIEPDEYRVIVSIFVEDYL